MLEALVPCRHLQLDKNPGAPPIGIREVIRRIIGKSVRWVRRKDVKHAAGPSQTATGLPVGAEVAI